MTVLFGLILAFLVLTLMLIIGLVVVLRRRLTAGRRAGQLHAEGGRMPSPAARKEE